MILAGCIAVAFVIGLFKGLVSQFAAFAAIAAGIWASARFSIMLGSRIATAMPGVAVPVINVICFIVIFIAVAVLLGLLGRLLNGIVKLALLGWVNRLLGAVFAALACMMLLGLAASLFETLYSSWASVSGATSLPGFIAESSMYRAMLNFERWMYPYLMQLSM